MIRKLVASCVFLPGLLATVASAQYYLPGNPADATYLIAAFDFSQLPHENDTYPDDDFITPLGSLPGYYSDTTTAGDRSNNVPAFVPRGVMYFDGTHGASVWDGGSLLGNPGTVGGADAQGNKVNETVLTSRRLVTAPLNLVRLKNLNSEGGFVRGLGFTPGGGASSFSLVLDTTGYGRGFEVSFAAWTASSAATYTINWFAVGGSGLVAAGSTLVNSQTPVVYTVNLATVADVLANKSEAVIVAQLVGASNNACNFDNIQVVALSAAANVASSISGTPPAGQTGSPYSFALTVAGSPAPALSVTSGSLPPGLALSGNSIVGSPTTAGNFSATIQASNGIGTPATTSFSIAIVAGPQAPTITSLASASFQRGSPGTFQVTASGNPAPTFTIVGAPAWLTIGSTSGVLTGTPPASSPASVSFTLLASNGVAPNASQNFTLGVQSPPSFTASGSATFVLGQPGIVVLTSTGNPAPVFALEPDAPAWLSLNALTGELSGTPPVDVISVAFSVRASNGIPPDAILPFALTIDAPPQITSANAASFTTGQNGSFRVTAIGRPAPSFSVAGAPVWISINATTGVIAGTAPAGTPAAVTFNVRAANGLSPDAVQSFTLAVNAAPVITSAATATFAAGQSGSFVVTASGRPTPSFSLNGAPSWLAIDPNSGTLSGIPPVSNGPYVFSFSVQAQNGVSPAAAQAFVLVVEQAPTITSANTTDFAPGRRGFFTVSTSGNPAPVLSLGTGAPTWLDLNASTGELSGTPPDTTGSPFAFPIVATNPAGSVSQTFSLAVRDDPQPPAFTSAAATTFMVGRAGLFVVNASGVPAPTFSVAGAPAWLELDASTGSLTGTPPADAPPVLNLPLAAANGNAPDAAQNFVLTINASPVFAGSLTATFPKGESGLFTLSASGRPAPQYSLAGAPSWLSVNPSSGVFSGTPPSDAPDTVTFGVVATNGLSPDAAGDFVLHISDSAESPVITSAAQATFAIDQAGNFTVTATGIPAPTFAVQGSPAWVSMDATTGALSGTPPPGSPNTTTFVVRASNGVAPDASQSFLLRINAPPAFTSVNAASFTAGQAGSFLVAANGRPAPTFALVDAPGWLAINSTTGEITGLPPSEVAANVDFSIRAENGVGAAALQSFSLSIRRAPQITSAATARFVAGQPGSFAVTATGTPAPSFVVTGAPAWLTLQSATGELRGTPPDDSTASVTLEIEAANGLQPNAKQTFQLEIVTRASFEGQPKSAIAVVGRAVEFSVTTKPGGSVSHQWLRDGTAIAGATGSTLQIDAVTPADAAAVFSCRVTNEAGSVDSKGARVAVVSPAERSVVLGGDSYQLTVDAATELQGWTVRSSAGWVHVDRVTTSGIPFVDCRIDPLGANGEASRIGTIVVELAGVGTAEHTVRQERRILLSAAFPAVIDPNDTSSTWQPLGTSIPIVASDVYGRNGVLALFGVNGVAVMEHSVAAAEPAAVAKVGLVSRVALPAASEIRLEADVLLELASPALGITEAAVGTSSSLAPSGILLADAIDGVAFGLAHDPAGAVAGSTGIWIAARYRDESGRQVTLNREVAIPHPEFGQTWVRLQIDVSASRSISFWLDPEPFGDPVRVWAPAPKVASGILAGHHLVAQLGSASTNNRPYLARVQASEGNAVIVAASELINLSTRTYVGSGDQIAIAGVVTKGGPARLLIRGVGPGLRNFSVGGVLDRPRLVAYDGNSPAFIQRVQDGWEGYRDQSSVQTLTTAFGDVAAFPFVSGSADSAWIHGPGPGLPEKQALRTVHLKSVGANSSGVALLELYRMRDAFLNGRLINLSTRAFVPAGFAIIPGFVVDGNASRLYLVRAVGPGLSTFGVNQPLAHPSLRFYQGNQLLRQNTGWTLSNSAGLLPQAAAAVSAFALGNGSADSALVLRLPPGAYTAPVVSSDPGEAGAALVEIYEIDDENLDTVILP